MNGHKKNKKKKRKINFKALFFLICPIIIIVIIVLHVANFRVQNIYVEGNNHLVDQKIIDISGLSNYPKVIKINKKSVKDNLLENEYIKDVNIKYKNFGREIIINVEENIPIIFYQYDETYILSDGSYVKDKYSLPILINQTPDNILKNLVKKLSSIEKDALYRISEIRYYPSNVDDELFLLTMEDGNYVYINLYNINKLDNYLDVVKAFDNKKGIIHFDSGNYLEVFNNLNEDKIDDKNELEKVDD